MSEDTKSSKVQITAEQLAALDTLIAQKENRSSTPSVYDSVDPTSIRSVNVKRFNGKFVVVFKDLNTDKLRTKPKYIEIGPDPYETDPLRKTCEYVYVIYADGSEEKVRHMDLMVALSDSIQLPVLDTKKTRVVKNDGVVAQDSTIASITDAKGNPITPSGVRAESLSETYEFLVDLPEVGETWLDAKFLG